MHNYFFGHDLEISQVQNHEKYKIMTLNISMIILEISFNPMTLNFKIFE